MWGGLLFLGHHLIRDASALSNYVSSSHPPHFDEDKGLIFAMDFVFEVSLPIDRYCWSIIIEFYNVFILTLFRIQIWFHFSFLILFSTSFRKLEFFFSYLDVWVIESRSESTNQIEVGLLKNEMGWSILIWESSKSRNFEKQKSKS